MYSPSYNSNSEHESTPNWEKAHSQAETRKHEVKVIENKPYKKSSNRLITQEEREKAKEMLQELELPN